jgi:hypothetical protein
LSSLQDSPRDYLFEEFTNHEFTKAKLNVIGEEMSKEDGTLFAYWTMNYMKKVLIILKL